MKLLGRTARFPRSGITWRRLNLGYRHDWGIWFKQGPENPNVDYPGRKLRIGNYAIAILPPQESKIWDKDPIKKERN